MQYAWLAVVLTSWPRPGPLAIWPPGTAGSLTHCQLDDYHLRRVAAHLAEPSLLPAGDLQPLQGMAPRAVHCRVQSVLVRCRAPGLLFPYSFSCVSAGCIGVACRSPSRGLYGMPFSIHS